MAEVYDIYGTEVKIGNIIAYSSLSSEQLRIAVVIGIYDDEDYIKVIACDSRDYYKVKSKIIKVKVDNILKLNKGQIDPQVAHELDYYGHKYFDNNIRHAEDLAAKGWTIPKPHNPRYYAVVLGMVTGPEAYEPTNSLKDASETARMLNSVHDNTVVCCYHKGEVVRIYNLQRKVKDYNQDEVDLCQYAVDKYLTSQG